MSKERKFNIIDILVVLAVVLFSAGLCIRFLNPASKSVNDKLTYEYTIKVSNIRQYTLDALNKSDKIINGTTMEPIGEIVSIKTTPFVDMIIKDNGDIVKNEVPEKLECMVTIRSDECKETDNAILINDGTEIKIGSFFLVNSKYVGTSGTIVAMNKID